MICIKLTKLDLYDYRILPGIIRISIDAQNDPILVDIFSELSKTGGRIYVDGKYYIYLDNYIVHTTWEDSSWYLDLEVVETTR